MKILHFHIGTDKQIEQYIGVLSAASCKNAETKVCNKLTDFRKIFANWQPDIVHLHGCWHLSISIVAIIAIRGGARIVLTPHGQLEPWIVNQHYWTSKLPKLLLYQRHCICHAYAVIAMGRMESGYLTRLGYNPRIETVHNALFTDTISDEEMASQIYDVYMKVLDTDVMELLAANTRIVLKAVVKAGISGDARWLSGDERDACRNIDLEEWRKLSVCACQEKISDVVRKGISIIGMTDLPSLCEYVNSYLPQERIGTEPLAVSPSASNDDKLIAMIRKSHKLCREKRLCLRHIIDAASFLRHTGIEEDKITSELEDRKLTRYSARLMSVLSDMTGLEEGFMLLPAVNDRKTKKIAAMITKHLKI